jgi:hypothetical protein
MSTTNVEERRAALLEQIRVAFIDVGRDGGVSLHEADVIDDYGSMKERVAARKLDTDCVWRDVPESDIERYFWILSFLDPIGFRYYMPAYMTWTLKHYEHSGSISVDRTIYALDFSDDLREFAMERYTLMNQEQSEAICAFLRFMEECMSEDSDFNVAHQALERYWGQFCQ